MDSKIIEGLFKNEKLADVKVIITKIKTDSVTEDKIEIYAHKFVLFAACPYFHNLINFKGDKIDIINIPIFDPLILYDIVASFYGIKQNSTTLSKSAYLLEIIRCRNFLCMNNDKNLVKLYRLEIPEKDFGLLLEIAYIIGYTDAMVQFIYANISDKYDFANIDNNLLDKLLNYNNAKIVYLCGNKLVEKKYHPFIFIPKNETKSYTIGQTNQKYDIILLPDRNLPAENTGTTSILEFVRNVNSQTKGNKIIIHTTNSISVYYFSSAALLYQLSEDVNAFTTISISHDYEKMITCKNCTIKIWDITSGKIIKKIIVRGYDLYYHLYVSKGIISIDETKIIGISYERMLIFDYETGILLKNINTNHFIKNIYFSDNNKIVTVGGDHIVKIWNIDGVLLHILWEAPSQIEIQFSLISTDWKKIILVNNDNSVQIWDIETASLITKLTNDSCIINACMTPDDKKIILISEDRTIKLWDLGTGKMVGSINVADLSDKDNLFGKNDNIKFIHMIPFVNKLSGIEEY